MVLPLAEVTNPQLITVVGCAGLVSNIVGLFLFHDHGGHSHGGGGGGGHGHSHGGSSSAPKAHAHSHGHGDAEAHAHSSGERSPLLRPGDARVASPAGSSTAVGVPSDGSAASDDEDEEALAEDELYCHPGEMRANVLKKAHNAGYGTSGAAAQNGHEGHAHDSGDEHGGHGGHAGSDGAMNMQGVFLHVLGDAVRLLVPLFRERERARSRS